MDRGGRRGRRGRPARGWLLNGLAGGRGGPQEPPDARPRVEARAAVLRAAQGLLWGTRLRALRDRAELSQADLAWLLGCSRQLISRAETGAGPLPPACLALLLLVWLRDGPVVVNERTELARATTLAALGTEGLPFLSRL